MAKTNTKVWISIPVISVITVMVVVIGLFAFQMHQVRTVKIISLSAQVSVLQTQVDSLQKQIEDKDSEITSLSADDQRLKNLELQDEIDAITDTYKKAQSAYESLVDLTEGKGRSSPLQKILATVLDNLSKREYVNAGVKLKEFDTALKNEQAKIATTSASLTSSAIASNSPPSSGYRRQKVSTPRGEFVVDIVSADLSSTRVIVDTASNTNCTDNCPVLPLATYVSRSGAYAGVNGTYFCPESYPTCAGKKNSFDLLVMNKQKTYLNSDNNVYSQNPAAIFGGNNARFVARAQDAGRDSGVDSVISNFPLLLINGQNQFGGNDDPKMGGKGTRAFVGAKGNTAFIGVVRNATVAEVATTLQSLGLGHAINLDSGGSIALWANGGYKAGPGRSIPNAILFVKK